MRVGLHAAGAQFQDERTTVVRHQGLAQMRLRGLASGEASGNRFESGGHLIGVKLQKAAVVGAEAVPDRPGDDQAAELLVALSQWQRAQRDPGGRAGVTVPDPGGEVVGIILDERGEFLGSQPQRAAGAEGIGSGRMAGHGEDRGQSVEDAAVSGQLGQMELPALVGDHIDSGKLSAAERKAMTGHRLYRLLPRTSRRPLSLHAVAPGTVRASRNTSRGAGAIPTAATTVVLRRPKELAPSARPQALGPGR